MDHTNVVTTTSDFLTLIKSVSDLGLCTFLVVWYNFKMMKVLQDMSESLAVIRTWMMKYDDNHSRSSHSGS